MQVRPVFTQVGTGFLCGNSVVCGQTRRSVREAPAASARVSRQARHNSMRA